MAQARPLWRPAAALLRRLVGRVQSVDSGATAASVKRLHQSAGVVPAWLDIGDITVVRPVSGCERWE